MKIPKLTLTREHGSWALMFVPIILSLLVAGRITIDSGIMIAAIIFAFLSQVPVQTLLRHVVHRSQPKDKLDDAIFWTAVFPAAAAACCTVLMLHGHRFVIPMALVGMVVVLASMVIPLQNPHSIIRDLAGVSVLSLGAPAVYSVISETFDATAWMLWIYCVLFFGSGVVYVHMKIRAISFPGESLTFKAKIALGRSNLIFHLLLLPVALIGVAYFNRTPLTLIAFVPMTIHAIVGTLRLTRQTKFKTLGFLLLGHSILFGALIVVFRRF
jgi:hypothetical protein